MTWKGLLDYLRALHSPCPPFPGEQTWQEWSVWKRILWFLRQL